MLEILISVSECVSLSYIKIDNVGVVYLFFIQVRSLSFISELRFSSLSESLFPSHCNLSNMRFVAFVLAFFAVFVALAMAAPVEQRNCGRECDKRELVQRVCLFFFFLCYIRHLTMICQGG